MNKLSQKTTWSHFYAMIAVNMRLILNIAAKRIFAEACVMRWNKTDLAGRWENSFMERWHVTGGSRLSAKIGTENQRRYERYGAKRERGIAFKNHLYDWLSYL